MTTPAREWLDLLKAACPRRVPIAAAPETADAANAASIITEAAIGAGIEPFLAEAAQSPAPLLLIANDTHRYTDSASAIAALEALCRARGMRLPFRLLIATGSHHVDRAAERTQHEQRIFQQFPPSAHAALHLRAIRWHDACDDAQLAPLDAAGGIRFNRWLGEARHILAIGSMEPHYFAGITGAHKTLSIGVMARDDIAANHRHALSAQARGMRLAGNPIYEALAQAIAHMRRAGKRLFAINELIEAGHVARVWAGDPLDSLEAARNELRQRFCVCFSQPQDLIVSIVQPPLDRDLYQADKGIKNVETAVGDGGVILLDAACARGIGMGRFHDLLKRAASHAQAVKLVEEQGYKLGDHKAVRLRALTDLRGVKIGAVAPGLAASDAAQCGIHLLPTRQAAAEWAMRQLPPHPHTAIIEDAGNITAEIVD